MEQGDREQEEAWGWGSPLYLSPTPNASTVSQQPHPTLHVLPCERHLSSLPQRPRAHRGRVAEGEGSCFKQGGDSVGAARQPTSSALTLLSSSLDPVVPGEEQPLPDMPSGASLQAAAGPGDQQRRASKHFPPSSMGHAGYIRDMGSTQTGIMCCPKLDNAKTYADTKPQIYTGKGYRGPKGSTRYSGRAFQGEKPGHEGASPPPLYMQAAWPEGSDPGPLTLLPLCSRCCSGCVDECRRRCGP